MSKIKGVEAAVPALSLQALHETGTVPTITDTVTTGGQTLTQTVKIPPATAAQVAAVETCLEKSGVIPGAPAAGGGALQGASTLNLSPTVVATLIAREVDAFGAACTACLPPSFQQYVTSVVVPQQTITKVLNPPTTNTQTQSYTVAGVDPSNLSSGLITTAQLVSGTWFTTTPTDEILVSTAYASSNKIKVGQTWTINKTGYKVVGLVNPTLTGDTSDIYFDLSTLQATSSQPARINEVLVKVNKSANVNAVAAVIKKELPGCDDPHLQAARRPGQRQPTERQETGF